MDLSQPLQDYTPKRRDGSRGGLWQSLGLLSLALLIATLAGIAFVVVTQLIAPTLELFWGVLFGIVVLIITLSFIARRFEWIMPWYYLLPAILFLTTFTVFPVVLTVGLAFTDYAGIRNGRLNISSETPIATADATQLTVSNAATLRCNELLGARAGCNNVRAVVYATGELDVAAQGLEGTTLTLAEPLPEGRTVQSVQVFIPSIGFEVQLGVAEAQGDTLRLERAPPGDIDLETVTLRLDRVPIERRILSVAENTITLNAPLPDDLEYVSIARFNDFGWVGLDNFRLILAQANRAFWPVFAWNVIFAVATILINTVIGTFIALLLNNPDLQFRNLYRTLLIVPWALPGIITIQVWRGFLNENFGAINRFLALLDLPTYNWLGDASNFALIPKMAILLVNLWLGLPFMMTAVLGALSAIPRELYEAVRVDGANAWQGFWGVTAPLLRTALVPITLTGFAFNFNNFNLIFLLTDGGPPAAWGTPTARGTDILISWAYNEAFRSQGGYAYGLGSAISIIIFVITLAISLINFRVTGALKEEINT